MNKFSGSILVFLLLMNPLPLVAQEDDDEEPQKAAIPEPKPEDGKALIFFMRPSSFGFAVSSSVFDVTNDDARVIGILRAKEKVAYQSPPGKRMFMIVGESSDFLSADLEAGKTYYAVAKVRMGAWKARFSLYPMTQSHEKFKKWNKASEYVDNRAESEKWAKKHMKSIESKRAKYFPKWDAKSTEDKAELTLRKEDGI